MELNTREKGNLGESVACTFLVKHGYRILERNYLKKWGEIDIIAEKKGIINFFEVKSVMHKKMDKNEYRPEENVHVLKQRRLRRVIQTYLSERVRDMDVEFLFHVIVVFLDEKSRRASISFIENVIL